MNSPTHLSQPVLHLLGSGGFYGAERMLLDHCQSAPGRHQVLFLGAPHALLARFRSAGVACVNCPGLGAALAYLGARRRQRPLLNSHNFRGLALAWLAGLLWRLPLISTQHGFTPSSRKQRLYGWLTVQMCRSAVVDQVVCVARSIAEQLRTGGVAPNKLQVIANGLPDSAPAPQVSTPNGQWLAGYVGRLSQEKGPDLFLDCLIPLCQRYPQLHAVMLGDGPQRAALQARIDAAGLATRIRLPGFQDDMPAWLAQLDALVISSRTEGTPMVLLEAMQQHLPVVAFAVGGIPDVIEHRHSGLLAAPLAVGELAEHLQTLFADPALARQLAQAAYARQRQHHHLPTLAQRWERVYLDAALEACR
ncbi:glycosyltransferase [Pseudomonas cremoricolorata]|uniref:Glycosyl transferase family 1 n=1 Tax=Pseudomonas cremoricolorata TaxID=157783 RepID=A0A089WQH4_9PSED|nr:glycosyltransferase [Pseudomonas cremoricolorata]AIR90821.1 glycosyl transferase family 1 [Pseudomonas cremoricolorata]